MGRKIFWTSKRLEALSKSSLTLFQGFILLGVLGEVFGKIESLLLKFLFIIITAGFFSIGIIFSDQKTKEN